MTEQGTSMKLTHNTNRRDFLHTSMKAGLAGVLALKADAATDDAAGIWKNRQSGMSYRRLGRTGFMVSEVVCGGNTIRPTSYRHVELALDMGLNYCDTAPQYGGGLSEKGYAMVISGNRRDRVFMTSKVTPWEHERLRHFMSIFEGLSPEEQKPFLAGAAEDQRASRAGDPDYIGGYFPGQKDSLEKTTLSNAIERKIGDRGWRKGLTERIVSSVDASLERLNTDHLDIFMCPHGATTPYEVTNFPEIFEAFERLKKAGKALHLGVSAHTDPAGIIRAAIQTKIYSVAMVAYNVVNHEYVDAALEEAAKVDLGIIAMKVARPVYPDRGCACASRAAGKAAQGGAGRLAGAGQGLRLCVAEPAHCRGEFGPVRCRPRAPESRHSRKKDLGRDLATLYLGTFTVFSGGRKQHRPSRSGGRQAELADVPAKSSTHPSIPIFLNCKFFQQVRHAFHDGYE
jgi:aryl-alcohol dehydrogenase-like predicted oxidoreductase